MFSVDASLFPGTPITVQFNGLCKMWPMEMLCGIVLSPGGFFSEEVGLANKLSFPFPAFPQVGQKGSTFLLGQKKNRAISPPAGLVHKDVSPSPAPPVGNTWLHAHDMSAATEMFSMALSRNGDI